MRSAAATKGWLVGPNNSESQVVGVGGVGGARLVGVLDSSRVR